MLTLNNISFEFAGRYLYKNAGWQIKPGERIGLVGKNGTGKSTLLKLINGDYELREGDLSRQKSLTIGYLNQDLLSFESAEPIVNVAMQAFERELELERRINDVLVRMEHDHSEAILQELADLQTEFEQRDGYVMRSKTEEILEGLGFSTTDLERPLKEFSGGWRMRVMLAKMLLQQPDLLMLDEPTNHLDLPSIEWLEQYLNGYNGSVIVVSHDRTFLNRMVNKVVEVANQKLYHYTGNYDHYLLQKEERDSLQQRQFENQQQYIKEQEKFINRFKAKASKATAVQSRVKMLEKLDRVEEVKTSENTMKLQFKVARQTGKTVCSLEHVSKAYGNLTVFDNCSAEVLRGDKIALIGANGIGKSTMLRIIGGMEEYHGKRETGYHLQQSFYAQHQLESLQLNNDLLTELQEHSSEKTEQELRTVLGCFLFENDDVFKKVKVLSGGEKARIALAKTLLTEANFLLLDEPTNHLDMDSTNILIEALQQYQGSFVVVSHDRYFISEIANKIWFIEEGKIREYPGNYAEFQYWWEQQKLTQKSTSKTPKEVKKPAKEKGKAQNTEEDKQLKKLQSECARLEEEIAKIKLNCLTLEHEMAEAGQREDRQKLIDLSLRHEQEQDHLQKLESAYDEKLETLIELEDKLT